MYRSCIFCSTALGGNEAIETFPVGRSLAFDAWKGRLWAVCPRCHRWNLAPIEERWEAVEEAEKEFRDSRLRAHSGNIGLAKLRDGTRLIRIGDAVPLELATWRYGRSAGVRRRRAVITTGATILGASALYLGGAPLLAMGALPASIGYLGTQVAANLLILRQTMRPVLRIPAEASPVGRELVVRQDKSYFARLVPPASGEGLAVEVPAPLPPRRVEEGRVVRWVPPEPLRLEGELAQRFLERSLVAANLWGGRKRLQSAVERLEAAGGPEPLIHALGRNEGGIFPAWIAGGKLPVHTDVRGGLKRLAGTFRGELISGSTWKHAPPLPREDVLALEIAIHEEAERRALAGELAALQAAWREAEEIAAIADVLPDDPLLSLEQD